MHGLWQTNIPSRFLDELPEGNVEVTEPQGGFGGFAGYGGYGASRFDAATSFGSNYGTPGWQRAQAAKEANRGGAGASGFAEDDSRYDMDEDEALHHLPAVRGRAAGAGDRSADNSSSPPLRGRSIREADREGGPSRGSAPRRVPLTIEGELVAKSTGTVSPFSLGDRVFHQKFGNGNVTAIDGNKLTIQFDRAGEKRVVDSFVERV
jgi:DNA helicase-2/ATP-dependent DNA helicase PcrA